MKVKVTEADIAAAVDHRNKRRLGGKSYLPSTCCPVALALKRALAEHHPKLKFEGASWNSATARDGGFFVTFRLSAEVGPFVNAFDAGQPVKPFKFEAEMVKK